MMPTPHENLRALVEALRNHPDEFLLTAAIVLECLAIMERRGERQMQYDLAKLVCTQIGAVASLEPEE